MIIGIFLLLVFLIFTVLLKTVDVKPYSATETEIGFFSINSAVFKAIGTNDLAYEISEILGLLVLIAPFAFAILALVEWIKRKSLLKIDRDLWALFVAYALTLLLYCFFELVVINFRPILAEGVAEASYPSSHTLLAIVIGGTALLQIKERIRTPRIRIPLLCIIIFLMVAVPLLRLLSGVHWLTDIIAAVLLGSSILMIYRGVTLRLQKCE